MKKIIWNLKFNRNNIWSLIGQDGGGKCEVSAMLSYDFAKTSISKFLTASTTEKLVLKMPTASIKLFPKKNFWNIFNFYYSNS